MELSFENHVALVTGASSGIGRATARTLADAGATVIGLDITDEPNDDGPRFETVVSVGELVIGDVSDPDDVDTAIERAREYGPVSVAVNNAGIKSQGSVGEVAPDEWERQFAVHVEGTYNVCHRLAPRMADRGDGRIVNVVSIAALRGFQEKSDYGASKGAIDSLTRHIATDYSGDGVRANAVAPGIIKTGRSAHIFEEDESDEYDLSVVEERTLLPHFGEPSDVANAIAFLASDAAGFVTGETLVVDGGWSAW